MRGLRFRGRPPIRFAESVKDVARFKDPYAQAIMDRNFLVTEEFVDAISRSMTHPDFPDDFF